MVLLIASIAGLIWIGYYVAPDAPADNRNLPLLDLIYPRDRKFLLWVSVALSGVAGGAAFDLKWLYHSWAKWTWNCDRLFWRLLVPILSGCVAVFVSMMVSSGVLSFINPAFFNNFYGSLSAGFLIGYFSDNALAALQNVAMKWFGTVDKKYTGRNEAPGHDHDDKPA